MPLPEIVRHETGYQLLVDGKPTILLGGQVRNSSTSHAEYTDRVFRKAGSLNYNFVIGAVSWSEFEPEEGVFDFHLLEEQLKSARANKLRLALIWFGAFKNATGTYAPSWVRKDSTRFPRAQISVDSNSAIKNSRANPVLSVFSEALCQADTRAFEALMSYLSEHDPNHTVVMVQVENEVGLLGAARDYSPEAEAAWLEHGSDWPTEEAFMAWGFASYCERLAKAGKRIKALPMFVNAWLGPQPGQTKPGDWPSGGPSTNVLEVWKATAPSIDILCPDIYVPESHSFMAIYHREDNPLFIPESRHKAADVAWALGEHHALGYSVFGAEDGRVGNKLSELYGVLIEADSVISQAQRDGRIWAVLPSQGAEKSSRIIGDTTVTAVDAFAALERFVEHAGVDLNLRRPEPASELENLPVAIDSATEFGPFGLVIQESPSEFLLIGQGVNLVFESARQTVEIDYVQEGKFTSNTWVKGRTLNGDERLNQVPLFEIGCARIRVLTL